jgi:hypothetical protein
MTSRPTNPTLAALLCVTSVEVIVGPGSDIFRCDILNIPDGDECPGG